MAVDLKVRWDGAAPGLAKHRLSLLSFGPALAELHRALRTAATRIETGKDPNLAAPQRKYSARARNLDVQIRSVAGGFVSLEMDVVVAPGPGGVEDIDDELATRAVEVFLVALRTRAYLAAAYLQALGPRLPPTATKLEERMEPPWSLSFHSGPSSSMNRQPCPHSSNSEVRWSG